jgi:hypothetical protein
MDEMSPDQDALSDNESYISRILFLQHRIQKMMKKEREIPRLEDVLKEPTEPDEADVNSIPDFYYKQKEFIKGMFNVAEETVVVQCEDVTLDGVKAHKVPIQPMAIRVPFAASETTTETAGEYWAESTKEKVFYVQSNAPCHPLLVKSMYQHGLIEALMYAYTYHADVVLSPDDMWLTIAHGLALHILNSAEELRSKFVDHKGQKEIIVAGAPTIESADWEDILSQFQQQLQINVKGEFATKSLCDFTTTGRIERYASNISLMCAMQKYFKYAVLGCGIRNVYFLGTLEDWQKLRTKVEMLPQYGLEGWSKSLLYIIDHWIESYQGRVNRDFWGKMVDKIHGQAGSGMSNTRNDFTGWIVYLAQRKYTMTRAQFPKVVFEAPFVYVEATGKISKLKFVAGYTGLRYSSEAFRPQLSYAVIASTGATPPEPPLRMPPEYSY